MARKRNKDAKWDRMVAAASWFGTLANAHYENNFQGAAKAEAELARLGVIVKFKRKPLEVRS